MTVSEVGGEMAKAGEALVNADGEVAVFVAPMPGRPLRGRCEGGGILRITLAGEPDAFVGCPPEAHEAMAESGRMLLVEVDPDKGTVRESWIGVAGETAP